jgi:hypothetical protein
MLSIRSSALCLKLAHKRHNRLAKRLQLFVVMQKRRQQDIHAQALQQHDAVGNLRRSADQLGFESVVVLHQILELGVGPHAGFVAGAGARVTHFVGKGLHRRGVGFALDFLQHVDGFFFRGPCDDKAIDREFDLLFAAFASSSFFDVRYLFLKSFKGYAIREKKKGSVRRCLII